MAGKGEEVAGAIDAHVREAVDKLVSEIRSSIEDVREAVDQQLRAALQSVQADVNSLTLMPQIQKALGDLAPGTPSAPPSAGRADVRLIKRAIQSIERGKSQVDVLNALLEQALQFGSRSALLILRGETFSGWKGMGFSAHGGNDENIKRFNAAPGLVPEIDGILKNERVVEWDGANLASRFGAPAPSRALLIPMVIKDKVAAALYVDAIDGGTAIDRGSLELLVFTTGLLVDTLAIRKKIPSPTLSDDAGAAPSAAAPPAPARPSVPTPAPAAAAPPPPRPAPPAAPRPVPPPAPSPAGAEATVAFNAAQMREAMAAAGATAAAPAAAKPSSGFAAPGGDDRPSTQFVPPAGMQRNAATAGASGEQSKRHDEARRFARLLVSEIKLYNEAKVEQGRRNNDLYERLKEDIDRSRQMYDERIAEDVRKTSNYFYDELVRVLADGNAAALGL